MAPGVRCIDCEILATEVFIRECFLSAMTSVLVHGRHLARHATLPIVLRLMEKMLLIVSTQRTRLAIGAFRSKHHSMTKSLLERYAVRYIVKLNRSGLVPFERCSRAGLGVSCSMFERAKRSLGARGAGVNQAHRVLGTPCHARLDRQAKFSRSGSDRNFNQGRGNLRNSRN